MASSKLRCRQCKSYGERESMLKINNGNYCNFDCAAAYGREKSLKVKRKEESNRIKAQKSKDRAALESLKTLDDLIKEAQIEVNRYIRLRDRNKPCISCDAPPASDRRYMMVMGGAFDAGHYRSRGGAGHLRFNLLNIHAQCKHCNRYLGGNYSEYRLRLIERIGLEVVERLDHDNRVVKMSKGYVRRVRAIFRRRANWYAKRKNL